MATGVICTSHATRSTEEEENTQLKAAEAITVMSQEMHKLRTGQQEHRVGCTRKAARERQAAGAREGATRGVVRNEERCGERQDDKGGCKSKKRCQANDCNFEFRRK
eukprot:6190681-Pleurochrysis_carterae.AAC.1